VRRWEWSKLLAIGGIILILVAILIGIISWPAFLVLRGKSNYDRVITRSTALISLPTTSQNSGQTPTAASSISLTEIPTGISPTKTNVDIDGLLRNMSLEEKVGQMIMTGIPGQTFNRNIKSLIETYHFGSVVYFAENTSDPGKTLKLSQDLQQAAATSGHGIPLLVAVDHEGGAVFRFKEGLTHFANPMTLGAADSVDLAYQVAAASARELRAVGINTSLGPVLDVNDEPLNPVIGVRAFGGFPDLVTKIGLAYLHGLQQNGIIAAAKHYPGHGSTIEDSHIVLPIVNKSEQQMELNELVPYRSIILAYPGIIQVGHVSFPQLDTSGVPATLSPILIEQKLRDQMGYSDVVMTDAMSMGAIINRYTTEEAAILAVGAGNDLLSYPETEMAITAYQAILAGVYDGSIPLVRVEESARRILELKARYNLFDFPQAPALETHGALARQSAQAAVVFSGKGSAPLVSAERLLLVSPGTLPSGSVAGDNLSLLGELLQMRGIEVDEWMYSVEDAGQTAAIQAQVQQVLPAYPQAVVVMWDGLLQQSQAGNLSQRNLVDSVLSSGVPVVFVAANSPFDLKMIPTDQPSLAIFGGLEYQVEILAEALLTDVLPSGKMPVSISH
jgi:beta-N-acetylhexosaminidase